ncbi:Cholinephosphotransferase [Rhizobium freirei PRF 81]|uniref:Cholinephosphotransferase n=1 Tax=Rhizobium freirei PRF 81 TaxID=363754 RepID=N6TW30_9HYPH|nr:CDP-alcohol phosphatidyltransferase family protein [Rhizobium freirei]ENN84649.1 Cholinephosphotransferase [Rhizobium freirei PRF 81]
MTKSEASAAKPSATNHDITDRLVYPLLSKLVVLIPRSVHPNTLTLAAIGVGLVAAGTLALSTEPYSLLACAGLLVLWILLDSCDGIHARNTSQCSEFGGFLDHFGDALGFFVLQAAIVYRFDLHEPLVFGAMLLRQALACWTYIIRIYAGHLFITRLGWSFEIYAYAAVMVALFYFPDFRLQIGSLPSLDLLGTVLLAYYIAVPMTLLEIGLMVLASRKKSALATKLP